MEGAPDDASMGRSIPAPTPPGTGAIVGAQPPVRSAVTGDRPVTAWRDESAISDLAGHRFEEEDYPILDFESDLQTAISTTVR
uniref:Uncharacterized protein n=1 Tax=Oryza sativa subsp. japonica TaxID=39947 RepID=Q851H0_ORYSJ|nr:hypothetical protein [Oryza sativa Japonica Group]